MTYDGAGRMLTGSDDDSSLVRNYDSLGRVIQETLNSRTTTSVYDGVGNLKSTVYPSGRRIVRTYDEVNRLSTVKDAVSATDLAQYHYAGQRRIEFRDYPIADTRLIYSYDGAKRLTGTHHFRIAAGTTIDLRSVTWDRASNKTSRLNVVTGLLHEYDYDSGYQLVASHRSGAGTSLQDITYDLDGVGNRHLVTGGPLPGTYTLSALNPPADFQMNQYTSVPGTSHLYDPAGNLTGMSGAKSAQVRYDYRNEMVEYLDVSSVPTHTHVYRYDVLGRRIAKVVDLGGASEVITQYFYSESHVVEEQNGVNAVKATYVRGRGIDEILNMRRSGVNYYFHSDDMGNVMKVTSTSAAVVESYEYRDYGEVLDGTALTPFSVSSISNALLFTGARFDSETGLYHLRSRYMDPQCGRFTTRDAIGIWGDVRNRGNGHTYAACNPWTFVDPTGTDSKDFYEGVLHGLGIIIGAADAVSFGNVSKFGEAVNGKETWDEFKKITETSHKAGEWAGTAIDLKAPVKAAAEGAVRIGGRLLGKGAGEAVQAGLKHGGDELAALGQKAMNAADKVADAKNAAGTVDTAVNAQKTTKRALGEPFEPGKPFTQAQKREFLEQNAQRNGGELKSDLSGEPLVKAQQSKAGVTPPANEAHIDHIKPKSMDGTNAPDNEQVISRAENLAKGNKWP
jgi:RHS repeat-associated protein